MVSNTGFQYFSVSKVTTSRALLDDPAKMTDMMEKARREFYRCIPMHLRIGFIDINKFPIAVSHDNPMACFVGNRLKFPEIHEHLLEFRSIFFEKLDSFLQCLISRFFGHQQFLPKQSHKTARTRATDSR